MGGSHYADLWEIGEEHHVLNKLFCKHVHHPPTDNHGHSETFMEYVYTYHKDGGPLHAHAPHNYR